MKSSSVAQRTEEQFTGELRQARLSRNRLPDFFIVGHAKCGTTAMHQMLRAHPRIYMPVMKETDFLAREPPNRVTPSSRQRQVRPQTLEAYLSLFEGAEPEQCAGEASTSYLRTPLAASRIAELRPDARIVAIFREPAGFLRSLHLQLLQVGIENESDFSKALGLEALRRRGRFIPQGCAWPHALQYSQHVRYVEQLRRYHALFGRERVLPLIYDDFRSDNKRVTRDIFRFLEVDDSFEIESAEANPTVRVRSPRAEKLIHSLSMGRGPVLRGGKATVKAVTSGRLRRAALKAARQKIVDSEPALPDLELMEALRQRFKPEVVAASTYLERDLVDLWEYDDVA